MCNRLERIVADHQNGRWSPRCDLQHAGSLTANELVAIGSYIVAVVRFLNSPRTTPQNFSQRIKCTSLGRLNDIA